MSERLPDPDPGTWPDDPDPWIRVLDRGTPVVRIHPTAGPYPARWNAFRSWGPTNSRFDHHPGPTGDHPDHRILYGSVNGVLVGGTAYPGFVTAHAEYYQSTRTIAPGPSADWIAIFTLARPLRLLDLGDSDWVTVAGGNGAITSGPRDRARLWAQAIHRRYPDVQGLVYPSSVVPAGRAVALWERATPALPRRAETFALSDPAIRPMVENAARRLNYRLA
ncbi:RES family NAD+ phosphorylase [Nakamurella alba]|uniref:RES family NAD+ phosphorylase n=1 Tax=Nakamurella alba TaxID=2665158 RepID=UPI0012B893E1|nr:RES family NAD+ phosphorylase [Nakamurella alba]